MLNCTGATVKDLANELLLKIASFFEDLKRMCRTWSSGQKEGLVCKLIYEEKRLYIHGVGAGNRGYTIHLKQGGSTT